MRPTATTAAPPRPVRSPAPLVEVGRREQLAARLHLRPDAAWALARFSLDVSLLVAAGLAAALGARPAGTRAPRVWWASLSRVAGLVAFAGAGVVCPSFGEMLPEDPGSGA